MAISPPLRLTTSTLLIESQPPSASASSTMDFSGSCLPPRTWWSAVITGLGTGVLDAVAQRLGREAADHHRVRGTDARTGLHGRHAFDGHRNVDDNPVALADADDFRPLAIWQVLASSSL
jgi:hypothetical protein